MPVAAQDLWVDEETLTPYLPESWRIPTYRRRPGLLPEWIEEIAQVLGGGAAATVMLDEMASAYADQAYADGHYGRLAREVYLRGTVWTSDSQPTQGIPDGLPPLPPAGDWRRGGCHLAALGYSALSDDVVHWVGWLIWPEDGRLLAWAHEWCATREGILIDPSHGICGVPEGRVYIGITQAHEESLDSSPMAPPY